MSKEGNQSVRQAKGQLEKIASDTERFLKTVSGSAEHINEQKTSTIYGIIGAVIGTLIGVGIDLFFKIGVVDDIVVSGALTALGAAVGVRVFRGGRRVKIEKHLDEHRIIHEDIMTKLKALPKDAPESIKLEYYDLLSKLNKSYYGSNRVLVDSNEMQTKAITNSKSKYLEKKIYNTR